MPLSSVGIDLHTALSHHEHDDGHHEESILDQGHLHGHYEDHHEENEVAHNVEQILIGFAFHAHDDHSSDHQHLKAKQLTYSRNRNLDISFDREEILSLAKIVALSSQVDYQLLKKHYHDNLWSSLYEKTYKPSPHQFRNRPLLN